MRSATCETALNRVPRTSPLGLLCPVCDRGRKAQSVGLSFALHGRAGFRSVEVEVGSGARAAAHPSLLHMPRVSGIPRARACCSFAPPPLHLLTHLLSVRAHREAER